MIALGYILSITYGALCVLAGVLCHKAGIDKKYTRKLVHILIGGEWFVLFHTVGVGLNLFFICLLFTLALAAEYKIGFLPAMSSSDDNAPGTVYYGLAMSTLSLLTVFVPDLIYPFGVAVLCTSLGDGIGGLVGGAIKRGNVVLHGKKTLFGTLVLTTVSFIGVYLFSLGYGYEITLLSILEISLFAASVELISKKGTDNLTLPLSTAALTYLLVAFPILADYAFALTVLPLALTVICEKKVLTPTAAVGAALLALVSSAAFKNVGALLLLIYFCLAVTTDKIKNLSEKSRQNKTFSHKSKTPRTLRQVVENGVVAFIFALLFVAYPSEIFAAGFVVSLAESLADTAASGIGSLSELTCDITRFKRCKAGLDGGVSLLGTISALAFAALFSFIAYIFGILSLTAALLSCVLAFVGMLVDSVLGSRLQPKYKCTVCGELSSNAECCGTKGKICSGFVRITNGTVNLLSSLFTSVLLCIILLAIS